MRNQPRLWLKVKQILCSKSGASLLYVLAVMLFLIAIGTSVLVAASTASSAIAGQKTHQQLRLYTDSVVKTFSHSLQNELGDKLLLALYENQDPDAVFPKPLPTTLLLQFEDSLSLPPNTTEAPRLTLAFTEVHVAVTPATERRLDETGAGSSPPLPKRAVVNATMRVTMKLTVNKTPLTSVATYRLTDGQLEDHGGMTIQNAGKWRLESYETLDN